MPTAAPMPDTMLAVRVHGPGDLRVDRVSVPEPGDGEVLLREDGACQLVRRRQTLEQILVNET